MNGEFGGITLRIRGINPKARGMMKDGVEKLKLTHDYLFTSLDMVAMKLVYFKHGNTQNPVLIYRRG